MDVRDKISEDMISEYQEIIKPKVDLKNKKMKKMYLILLVSAIIGGIIGGVGVSTSKGLLDIAGDEGLNILILVSGLVWFIVSFFIHVFIHEAGHLVFGLISGYRFLSYRVFSIAIVKKDGRLLCKKLKVAGTLGQCLMYPPKWEENKHYPYVLYNLGGGFLNAIFSIILLPLVFSSSSLVVWGAGITIVAGAIMALSNLIPMSVGLPNDGMNCLKCSNSHESQRALYIQLMLNAALSDGSSIDEFNSETFTLKEGTDISNMLTGAVRMFEYYRRLYIGEYESAKQCLSELKQYEKKMPLSLINLVNLEVLYCMLIDKASLVQIAAVYKMIWEVFKKNVTDLGVLRIKYTYAVLLSAEEREQIELLCFSKKGKLPKKLRGYRPYEAEKIYESAIKTAEKHPVAGEVEFQMRILSKYSPIPEN